MSTLKVPEFTTYEEEARFWDQLDTADFMEDDGEWFQFETLRKRALHKRSKTTDFADFTDFYVFLNL